MKKKKLSKIIICTLLAATVSELYIPTEYTFAETENKYEETIDFNTNNNSYTGKSNFVMVSNSLDNFEYTYDKNGKSYKVKEKINETFDEGETRVYEKKESGDYELVSTIFLTRTDDSIKQKIIENDNITYQEDKLSDIIDVKFEVVDSNKIISEKYKPNSIRASSSLTGWQYCTSIFSSTKFPRYSMTSVTATICGLLGYAFAGPVVAGVVSGVSALAGIIISDEIPLVYYGQDVYHKNIIGTDPPLPRAEKTITWFYSDSRRKYEIGDENPIIFENYAEGWS